MSHCTFNCDRASANSDTTFILEQFSINRPHGVGWASPPTYLVRAGTPVPQENAVVYLFENCCNDVILRASFGEN